MVGLHLRYTKVPPHLSATAYHVHRAGYAIHHLCPFIIGKFKNGPPRQVLDHKDRGVDMDAIQYDTYE